MMGKVFSFYFVMLLFTITFALFGILSDVNENKFGFDRMALKASACLFCILALYNFCNDADFITNEVSQLILLCTLQTSQHAGLCSSYCPVTDSAFFGARRFQPMM
jgi:hypothetical protein